MRVMRAARIIAGTARQMLAVAFLCLGALGLAAAGLAETGGDGERPLVLVSDIDGAIGPPATRQIRDLIEAGETRGAEIAIIRMDTPGGLTTSTREINKAILAARVPVGVYVAPPGARAASAGTYIFYAAHVAAMAPGTNIGAATPVQMGGGGPPGMPGGQAAQAASDDADAASDGAAASGEESGGATSGGGTGADGAPADDGTDTAGEPESGAPSSADAMRNKAINDAVAQIRSLAELRGRNADWAERAVREGASLSAGQAVERGVADLVADDMRGLLAAIDGRSVTVGETERALATADARVETLEPSLVTKLLGILANPNVALLLMTLGFYGLLFELSSPGLGPGIPGAILLLLGLYSLNLLPVDYAGLALIALGLALMAAEAITPAFGVLGLGGAAAFAIGAAILVDTDVAAYQVSWGVIAGITALSLAVVLFVVGAIWRTRRARERSGATAMIGLEGHVLDWADGAGHVRAHGERWEATGPADLEPGEHVTVTGIDGLTLTVARPSPADTDTARRETPA
jgi:membrane-bound serine protease (ClpP class)